MSRAIDTYGYTRIFCVEGREPGDEGEGVKIVFSIPTLKYEKRQAIKEIEKVIEKNKIHWIIPGYKEWTIYLNKLKELFPQLSSIDWLEGKALIEPDFEKKEINSELNFYIVPEALRKDMITEAPIEIQESLKRFNQDYPDSNKAAFIMMQFGKTRAHTQIVEAIKGALTPFNIVALRADDKQYHDDLFWNVITYLHGCGFGIAIFERIEAEEFNPNVSLEVGYMLALRKPVCLLKDRTLKTLHTDLIGKLYKVFDPQGPHETIPKEISKWLSDKGII